MTLIIVLNDTCTSSLAKLPYKQLQQNNHLKVWKQGIYGMLLGQCLQNPKQEIVLQVDNDIGGCSSWNIF